MDNFKKFFTKKKRDVMFTKAGPGKSLSSDSAPQRPARREGHAPRVDPSAGAQRAGAAAIDRFSSNKCNTQVDWSMQAIRAQARRELEAERRLQEMSLKQDDGRAVPASVSSGVAVADVEHVKFSCPLIGPDIANYDTIKAGIREMLYSQLGEDKAVAACLIIYTCNRSTDKIKVCVETLCKYIENIVLHPTEEKYRRIRHSNRAYQDRVVGVEGAQQFLEGAGFVEEELPFNEGSEMFWVFPASCPAERLEDLSASLRCGEAVRPTLERSAVVLLPQQAARQPNLPVEFFAVSKEEIVKEAQLRSDAAEESMVLRTKAMRDRQNMRDVRKYRFTFIRVRFSDGLTLQGTFRIAEKLEAVIEFIRGYLVNDWRPFVLCPSGGKKFLAEDQDRSLAELFLVPAAVLNFQWDSDVSDPNLDDSVMLGPDAYDLIQQEPLES